MRLALVLPMGAPSEIVGTARFAEAAGFDGVWMYENLYGAGAFAAAGATVAATSRVRVGIRAPRETPVLAREVKLVREENLAAAAGHSAEAVSRLLAGFRSNPSAPRR